MLTINDIFDAQYYSDTNPQVSEAIASGESTNELEHFEAVGLEAGLRFTPFADLNYYKVVANPDLVSLSNQQALDHLLTIGIDEGLTFSPFIDLDFYKSENPDVANLSNSEALLHLKDVGLEEGRKFSSFVNLEEYRSFNSVLSTQSLTSAFTSLATDFAPDDEGRIRVPFAAGRSSIPDETDIVTPEMLTGSGEATITYSKAENTVDMVFKFDGLPYRLDVTRPEDVSTPFNQQPVTVEDSKWQVWIIGNWFNIETNFWFDGATNDLIANEFELPGGPPDPTSPVDVNGDGIVDIAVAAPTARMIGTPIFEGNPDGTAQVEFSFDYDQFRDDQGTGGAYISALPYNLDRPEEIGIYYTEGGIPLDQAMTWDDILTSMRNSVGLVFATSLEPDPKPEYLNSRDNTMIAWSSFYPTLVPDGVLFDVGPGVYRPQTPEDLVIHANEPWPAAAARVAEETESVFGSAFADELDAADSGDSFDGNLDTLFTGAGDDFVDASQAIAPAIPRTAGGNRIYSGTGSDELFAGYKDRLLAGAGDDILDASIGSGSNRLAGGDGNDELFAGSRDRLFGGDGDDILDATAGSGNNRLYGQAGNDTFFAGSGDRLLGGEGDDAFFATDGGDNLIKGGAGADAFWIATGEFITAANTITDFEVGTDVIGVASLGVTSVNELNINQVGNNAVITLSGFDLATLLNVQKSTLTTEGIFAFA